MKHQGNREIRESNHILIILNEILGDYNDIWKYKWLQWYMERKCIDIMLTLNETPGKQGNQGIQLYIADIEWNLSEYNDIWKGNELILW